MKKFFLKTSADFNFNSASCLLACSPVIPAASSNKILLSSGFEFINLCISPCATIDVVLGPDDASANNKRTSFALTILLFI